MINIALTAAGLGMAMTGGMSTMENSAGLAGPLKTRWTDKVSRTLPLPDYPRPTMVRSRWQNLNGPWSFAISDRSSTAPPTMNQQILVPFAVESYLSGLSLRPDEKQRVWYRRTFTLPKAWNGQRILLHFGASDWETKVWVDGKELGTHVGGYDGFSFDVTDALKDAPAHEIVVTSWDPTSTGPQARGKQIKNPEGIFYTPITGIWQTVWLEPVPQASIASYKLTPEVGRSRLRVEVQGRGTTDGLEVRATALDNGKVVGETTGRVGRAFTVQVPNPKLWWPNKPFLYDLKVELLQNGKVVDTVKGYFGMRSVEVGKAPDGVTRILLNGEPLFLVGPLDQGFWPDGLYTAPTEAALKYDIDITKKFGMNMARKHVKVEPERWYYLCDKLGLAVFQDMPSGYGPRPMPKADEEQFEKELKAMVDGRYNHPSILMWVVFNEGWGQYDTVRLTEWTKKLDPSRVVNNASGWTDHPVGDVIDAHVYPGPAAPKPEEKRASVLGEFGGLGLPVKGHMWQDTGNWGYQSFDEAKALTDKMVEIFERLHLLIANPGVSAAVYTQTSDVEIESNGLMTYDREVIKPDINRIRKAVLNLFEPVPEIKVVFPTSQEVGQEWKYVTETPKGTWTASDYDDASWKVGLGGFGTARTPGSVVRTNWETQAIWLRRTFTVDDDVVLKRPALLIHHDEDTDVYLDSKPLAKLKGFKTAYSIVPIDPKLLATLKKGEHVWAVHTKQVNGGQYIDVGLVDIIPSKKGR